MPVQILHSSLFLCNQCHYTDVMKPKVMKTFAVMNVSNLFLIKQSKLQQQIYEVSAKQIIYMLYIYICNSDFRNGKDIKICNIQKT